MLIVLLVAITATSTSAKAEELGLRLARTSGIVTLAPILAKKDIADLAKEDPALSPEHRTRLMQIGDEETKAGIERVVDALGAAYAKHLSVQGLQTLVRQSESAEASRLRAAEPDVLVETAPALGSIDLKKITAARMCRETGKLRGRR